MRLTYLNLLPLYFRELIKDVLKTVKSDTFGANFFRGTLAVLLKDVRFA
jgi:hypothetical protein